MSDIGELAAECVREMDEHGWCQNTLSDKRGAMCARGVVNKVVNGDPRNFWARSDVRTQMEYALEAHISSFPGFMGSRLVAYNNDPITTYADIRELFEKTAADEGVVL